MEIFDTLDFDKWQEVADKCEYATFFHTPMWSRAFVETYPGMEIATKEFIFDNGMRAILPLIKKRIMKGLLNVYLSNVAGVYGGWISDVFLSHEQGNKIIWWISKNLKNFIWRVNPFDVSLKGIFIPDLKQDFTQYLDLRQGFIQIYKKWTRGHSSAIHQARREGVVIKEADSWGEWEQYFEIYQSSLRRWDNTVSSRYSITLFKKFFNQHSPDIKLWLARFENKSIAGALCFYHNHHVVAWHGASLKRYFKKRPSNLLYYEIIKDACDKGYLWFDFNPSGGHEGVRKFKKSFGTSSLETGMIFRNSLFYKLLNESYDVFCRGCRYICCKR